MPRVYAKRDHGLHERGDDYYATEGVAADVIGRGDAVAWADRPRQAKPAKPAKNKFDKRATASKKKAEPDAPPTDAPQTGDDDAAGKGS